MNPESDNTNTSGKRRREDTGSNSQSRDYSHRQGPSDDPDPLCCCEYINEKGERSHLLAFCCDCEALDDSFERLIQRQPQPKGRFNQLCNEFSDRFRIPWLHGARRIDLDVILPVLILPPLLFLGTYGPYWTAISFLLIPISIQIIRKYILYKIKRTKFYCSFTLTSFLLSYLIFELEVTRFDEITYYEYLANIILLCLTLGLMHQTRVKGQEDSNFSLLGDKLPFYYYCRTCQFYIDGRDHHCVWLNCCIGRNNKLWFVTAILVGCFWILYTINLSLTTICHPRYLFNRFLLVPVSCPDAYSNFDVSVCFVTAIYGMIVLVLLIIILVHQSRLVWRGVSYLDWKYANKQSNNVSSSSRSTSTSGTGAPTRRRTDSRSEITLD